ncbi:TPA: Rrf2 family transcriptional regulator [Klebsiella oxytoca]|nr:Rrf2 family transcriptional regulator [Klebsiella oxytoca]
MRITNKHEIAMLFVLSLGSENKTRTIHTLSAELNVSSSYLEQIARMLRHAGLIASVMGPGGGYYLTRPAKDITVKHILLSDNKDRGHEGVFFKAVMDRIGNAPVTSFINTPSGEK